MKTNKINDSASILLANITYKNFVKSFSNVKYQKKTHKVKGTVPAVIRFIIFF